MGFEDQLQPTIHLDLGDPSTTVAGLLRDIAVQRDSWVCWHSAAGGDWMTAHSREVLPILHQSVTDQALGSLVADFGEPVVTEDVEEVDSVFRAKRVLEEQSARLLLLLRNGRPAGLFKIATASAGHHDASSPRHWVTDMPEDETLFRQRVLFAGSAVWLRTQIVPATSLDNTTAIMYNPAELVDRKLQFRISGTDVKLINTDGAAVEEAWSDLVDPLSDDATFEIQLAPGAPGTAIVEVELVFDDGAVVSSDPLVFKVLGDPSEELPSSFEPSTRSDPLIAPPQASVRIDWHEDTYELKWERGGQPYRRPIAASRGMIEGLELMDLRRSVEALTRTYRAPIDHPMVLEDSDEAVLAFAQLGARLHAFVFGRDEHDVDRDTYERGGEIAALGHRVVGHRLTVHDDHVGLPWGLFYDAGYATGDVVRFPTTSEEVDLNGFWAYRFRIDYQVTDGRVPTDGQHVLTTEQPLVVPFVNPSIVEGDVEYSQRLVEMNDELLSAQQAWATVAQHSTDFLSWRKENLSSDVVYVFGHGKAATYRDERGLPTRLGAEDQAQLTIGAEALSVADLRANEPRPPQLLGEPLVFLNACEAMEGDLFYGSPFVDLFYKRWGARVVIGGVASLPARFAVGFASQFLSDFLSSSEQVGQVLHRTVRKLMDEDNPYGLLYALYGRSELQVRRTAT